MNLFRFALPFSLCVGLVLVGCGKKSDPSAASGNSSPDKIKIGFLVKQPEEPWFQAEWKGAEKAGAQYGFDVLKMDVHDGEKALAAIDNLAVSGAQGFVICTPDVRLGPQIVRRAKQKGLKVVCVDDQFVGGDGKIMADVHYLGMSASRIGHTVGVTLAAEMKKRGWTAEETAACVVTFEELDTARERTDNAITALKEAGFAADRIYKAPQKTTDIPGSFDATNILLTQKPNVKHWLIAGMNDSAVLGAVRSMERSGFTAETAVGVGINGTDCIDELRKPKPTGFFGSIRVSATDEGFSTAEMLYKWIKNGSEPALDTRTEGVLMTRENFEALLKKDGATP